MDKVGDTAWVRHLALERGFGRSEFNKMLRLQYGTKHTKKLTPEQLDNVIFVLKSFPKKKRDE